MYNKVTIVGHLTRDIEIRYTQSGSAIANSAIASTRKWKSQDGQQKEETMFIDITFFGRKAEVSNQYLRKGSKVLVDGRLVFQQWTAQDGTKRSKHAITVESMVMLDGRADGASGQQSQQSQPQYGQAQQGGYSQPQQGGYGQAQQQNSYSQPQHQQQPEVPEIDISDSEIPF